MTERPNILLVIVDDHGIHQLGCHGSTHYRTPRIDGLAAEGVRFTQSYSTAPVCSPARASLYTGRHPARLHLTNYIPGTEPVNGRLLTPRWRPYLPVEEETVGRIFQRAGYATGHFGKWHLAVDYQYEKNRPTDPESHGFEQVFVTRKPPPDADPEADPHHTEAIAHRAAAFIQESRDRPFFCAVAYNALHRPEIAPAAEIARFTPPDGNVAEHNRPVLAAMMAAVDRSVGMLLDVLEASGRARDTIVIFTSDHGAFDRSAERKPLRGAKADLYEAGIRVPLILRWPGRFRAGSVVDVPVQNCDLAPTLISLAGIRPGRQRFDGLDLSDLLSGDASGLPERDLCWHFPHYHHLGLGPCGAIRAGSLKLIEWFEGSLHVNPEREPFELYDLSIDPGEHRNLSAEQPERCAQLAERLRTWRRTVGAQEMTSNPEYDPGRGEEEPPPPSGDPGNPYGE